MCYRWVNQRHVFGEPLSSQGVVRSKLAAMISRVESTQNWLENITYQMKHTSYAEQATELAGLVKHPSVKKTVLTYSRQIAFLKVYTTRAAQDTARDAVQVTFYHSPSLHL